MTKSRAGRWATKTIEHINDERSWVETSEDETTTTTTSTSAQSVLHDHSDTEMVDPPRLPRDPADTTGDDACHPDESAEPPDDVESTRE